MSKRKKTLNINDISNKRTMLAVGYSPSYINELIESNSNNNASSSSNNCLLYTSPSPRD